VAIKVHVKVVLRSGRGHVLRWRDPETGAWKEKAVNSSSKKEAEKLAAQLEADLQQGRYVTPSKVTWDDFRLAFEAETLTSLAPRSVNSYRSALNHVEKVLHPERLAEIDAAAMSRLQTRLRDFGLRESSIATHLRHIKASLKWAHELGMLVTLPKVQMPKRARGQEEFERMRKSAEQVRTKDADMWKGLLDGLWLSGLRLGEALELSWDDDGGISIDVEGKYPCFVISAESEKGFRDRRLPITPDFAEVVSWTPPEDRCGKVFAVSRERFGLDRVSRVIATIGKKANVVVNKEQNKFASAHDLRRAFGTRWATRVTPSVLQQLMRHASIETTLKYYVEQDSDSLAEEVWKVSRFGDSSNRKVTTGK
jgi:integrase